MAGQLGDATGEDTARPVRVLRLDDAVEIAARWHATCARRKTGNVVCWGDNASGQVSPDRRRDPIPPRLLTYRMNLRVADGEVDRRPNLRLWPAPVDGLVDAAAIALGPWHACAIRTTGAVVCWGDNQRGQLGVAIPAERFERREITEVPPVVEIAIGFDATCARTEVGQVWCWGGKGSAQYGNLGTPDPGPTPRRVPGLVGAVGLELGEEHICARKADGSLDCLPMQSSPYVADIGKVRHLAKDGSRERWCALRLNAEVDCNFSKKGGGTERVHMPLADVVQLVGGEAHWCALLSDGRTLCWGDNSEGELGRHTSSKDSDSALRVPAAVEW